MLQLLYLTDRWIEPLQPAERVLPHLDRARSAEFQDRIELKACISSAIRAFSAVFSPLR